MSKGEPVATCSVTGCSSAFLQVAALGRSRRYEEVCPEALLFRLRAKLCL
jgi:hypothetical protein